MHRVTSRRSFVAGLGAAVTAAAAFPEAPKGIRYGYAAITWGKEERQAVDDISAAGYEGIQFRNEATAEFQPSQLRDLLAQHKLTFVALSSGDVLIDPAEEAAQLEEHAAHAKFVHDAGGLYLQVLDQLKTYPRTVTPDQCKRLGRLLTEIGKRTADIGVPLGYHNHLNTISEHPDNLRIVLESSDPKYVKLELDTAHYLAGGGDPAKAMREYHDRILFLHLKDVVDIPMSPRVKYPFQFVELGRGRVDFPAFFAAVKEENWGGWAVVELDRVPDKSRTPKEAAMISKRYLEDKIGAKV